MKKVDIIFKNYTKQLNSDLIIDDLYNGYSASLLVDGANDGVFYIKNFPKDSYYILQDLECLADVKNLGFQCDNIDIYPNNVLFKKKNIGNFYVVQPLDTITSICSKLNLDENSVIVQNHLKTNKLFVGQRLLVDI